MISDEELAQLPEDPELAFVEFERILRARADEQEIQGLKLSEEGAQINFSLAYKREYMSKVLAAAQAYGLSVLDGWSVPPAQDEVVPNAAKWNHVSALRKLRRIECCLAIWVAGLATDCRAGRSTLPQSSGLIDNTPQEEFTSHPAATIPHARRYFLM